MQVTHLIPSQKKIFISLIGIVVLVNIILLIVRYRNDASMFDTPLQEGAVINGNLVDSDKEILFILIKPKCPTCVEYHDSIISLYQKYKSDIQFIGLCREKFWNATFIAEYHFPFIKADLDKGKMLHLAVTPQIVLVTNRTITFSQEFNTTFGNEYQRLKKYLANRYPK
ncbi:MAG: hypothetical protein ACOYNC_14965 [Bacteroidales bacterium]